MDLDDAIRIIINDFVSKDGRLVDYNRLKHHIFWREKINGDCIQVKDKNLASGTENQKKAFFINLYNVMCVYAVCREETLPSEILKVKHFFDRDLCLVAGETFSLDDILHGVLRANSPHPASKTPYFGSDSTKRKFSLKEKDPRIIFAVNSADLSSPPLRVFTTAGVEKELDAAVTNFCQSTVSWNPIGRLIFVPRLLLWYRKDFPGGHDVASVRWVTKFLKSVDAISLLSLLDELECVGGVRITHDSHDWRLNKQS